MMMRPAILALAALLLAPHAMAAPVRLTASQVHAVQIAVVNQLRDPESARFGSVAADRDGEGVVSVCGWVNSKNGYGGYAGDAPFMGVLTGGRFVVIGIAQSDTERAALLKICASSGMRL